MKYLHFITLLIGCSILIQFVSSISSGESAEFEVDTFLNLPSGQMLRYAANEDQSDEVSSTRLKGKKLTEHPSQSTKSSMEISRKRIIQQRYMEKLKVCHPEKVKKRDKRHYERKKETLSKLTEEELISWKEGKRLEDKIQYRMRDLKRGYGRKQNESIKEIRRKVQQNQASPEEISKLNKLRQQKIKSYHSIKAKKASQKG